jgi:Domain of unknown function (DUF4365)
MRKQRTRPHIIEDLGFNHVERQILYAGFTVHRYSSNNDYGYDGLFHTFNERGEYENGIVFFQLKSTDQIQLSQKKKAFVFDLSHRDLELWLADTMTMLLVLYDAQKEIAYYIDLQAYFNENQVEIDEKRKFIRVFIPKENIFTAFAAQSFRQSINKI